MPNRCDDNSCEEVHEQMMDEVDSKVESLREYVDDKIKESNNYIIQSYLHHDQQIIDGIDGRIRGKIKRMLFYLLPPLAFLLILAMIL